MAQKYPLMTAVWKQNRARILVIGLLLLSVIGTYVLQKWVVEPKLLVLRTEQFRLQQHVRQRQMEYTNSGIPVSDAEQIEKNLQQFNQLIPAKNDFPNFIGDLFDWSKQSDLQIHQIRFQPENEKETGFLRYGLSFSVKGDYSQVKKFIHLLENTERILMIEKISLSGSSSRQGGGQAVDLKIELATYFQGGTV